MTDRQPWEPNIFPSGEEPDWVVGYEITPDGWRPIDAAREAELDNEARAELARGEGVPHEQVMAEIWAMLEARRTAIAK